MRPPHACYVIRSRDGRYDCKTLLPVNMRSCASVSIPKCAGPISMLHITLSQCRNKLSVSPLWQRTISSYHRCLSSKILPYMDRLVRHWFVLHSKFSFNTIKIQLIHLHLVQPSSELFHLHFCSSLCLKILTTIFISTSMYIKCLFSSNKSENRLPSLRLRRTSVSDSRLRYRLSYCPSAVVIVQSTQSAFPFAEINHQSPSSFVPVRRHLGDVQGIIKHLSNTQNHFISHSLTY